MPPSAEHIGFVASPLAMCVTQQRLVAACNQAFSALFGYGPDELLGQSIQQLYPSAQEFRRIGQRGYPQMQRGQVYRDERLMRHADGRLLWCQVAGRAADERVPARSAVWVFEALDRSVPTAHALSPREREVVTLLAQGVTSKEIARALGLSPRTVDMHRARLLRKFSVRSTTQLLSMLA